jgi:hypothetical protein
VLTEIQSQDEEVLEQNGNLKQNMQKRQQVNVAQLIQLIENDIQKNRGMMKSVEDQIREIDGNYQTFKTSNKVMDSNMVKLEQSLNEVSREEHSLQS